MSTKKKLLVLGSSKGSCEIVKFAKNHGIYTIVTDYLPPAQSAAKLIADEYWMISTADLDLLEKKCRIEGIDGILSGASDFNVEMCILLCQRLGLNSYCTLDAWHFSRDKADFKKVCKEVGAPVPTDYDISDKLSDGEINKIEFPVMVKPVDLSGNLGISYCYNKNDLINAYNYARTSSKNNKIIVERMLHGEEWYSTYAIANGEPRLVALNAMYSQPGEPKNCYTITTTVSNHVTQFIQEINPKIDAVLKKIGVTDGIAWVQVMLDEDRCFYIIEMGYRLDGELMGVPCRDICNFDSIKWLVEVALGKEHTTDELPLPQTKAFERCATSVDLWVNKGGIISSLNGFEEILQIPGVNVNCTVHVGDRINPYRAAGIITFTSNNCDELCEMIDIINNTISIINENGEDIVIKYTDFDYLKHIYAEGLAGR